MQKDSWCNSLVLSWQQVVWNRWETFEQHRDKSRGINRAVPLKQRGARLVTWFIIRPCKVGRLEGIRYDKLDLKEGGGEGAQNIWSKNARCIWQHVWLRLALCAICCYMTQERHKGFADSSVPSLTPRLCMGSFSPLFIWRFGSFFVSRSSGEDGAELRQNLQLEYIPLDHSPRRCPPRMSRTSGITHRGIRLSQLLSIIWLKRVSCFHFSKWLYDECGGGGGGGRVSTVILKRYRYGRHDWSSTPVLIGKISRCLWSRINLNTWEHFFQREVSKWSRSSSAASINTAQTHFYCLQLLPNIVTQPQPDNTLCLSSGGH